MFPLPLGPITYEARFLRVRENRRSMIRRLHSGVKEILGLLGVFISSWINGTGKSRMLQTLAETILTLETRPRPFLPLTLA